MTENLKIAKLFEEIKNVKKIRNNKTPCILSIIRCIIDAAVLENIMPGRQIKQFIDFDAVVNVKMPLTL